MISTTDLTQLRASHAHMKLALKRLLEFDTTNRGTSLGIGIDHEPGCGVDTGYACDCGFSVAIELAYSAVDRAWEGE